MLISLMDISLQPPKTSPQGMAHFLILFWQGINATHCFLVGLFCLTSLTQLLCIKQLTKYLRDYLEGKKRMALVWRF